MRKERIALENRIDLTFIRRYVVEALALKEHIARSRGLKTADDAQRRCLAAARRAEQRNKFLIPNIEIDSAKNGFAVKFFFDVYEVDQVFAQPRCTPYLKLQLLAPFIV